MSNVIWDPILRKYRKKEAQEGEAHDRAHQMDSFLDHSPATEGQRGTVPYSNIITGQWELKVIAEDKTFNHVQSNPASQWIIDHNLGKFPSVTVHDSSGTEVEGETIHTSNNQVIINFSAAFSGTADLN